MKFVSTILAPLDSEQKLAYYKHCANLVLASYALENVTPHFVQHNAGIVFRLDDSVGNALYLLKIHESAGDGAMDTPEQLAAQMAWLAELTADGRITVQSPIANRDGRFVTLVQLDGMDRLSPCTLQTWIHAKHAGQWNEAHSFAVGRLLATLHSISEKFKRENADQFGAYHENYLRSDIERLVSTVDIGLITAEQAELIRESGERVLTLLASIARTPNQWGLVHGDLHQGNVFFEDGSVIPIDYGPFYSYYLYDLGVSLYHATFDEVAIRTALVAGYDSVRTLTQFDHRALETFMIAAALANLAFQATLSEHRLSPINRRNMQQFVEKFCRPFVIHEAFLFDGRPLTIENSQLQN